MRCARDMSLKVVDYYANATIDQCAEMVKRPVFELSLVIGVALAQCPTKIRAPRGTRWRQTARRTRYLLASAISRTIWFDVPGSYTQNGSSARKSPLAA